MLLPPTARRGVAVLTDVTYRWNVRKKLSRIGNSVGIVLDRPLLEQLGLEEGSEVEISTDGSVILLSPKRDEKREARLKDVSDWMFDKYAGAFKKLAE